MSSEGGEDGVVWRAKVMMDQPVLFRGDGATLFTDASGGVDGSELSGTMPSPDIF